MDDLIVATVAVGLCPELPKPIPVALKSCLHGVEGIDALRSLKLMLTFFGFRHPGPIPQRRNPAYLDGTESVFIAALLPHTQSFCNFRVSAGAAQEALQGLDCTLMCRSGDSTARKEADARGAVASPQRAPKCFLFCSAFDTTNRTGHSHKNTNNSKQAACARIREKGPEDADRHPFSSRNVGQGLLWWHETSPGLVSCYV